MMSLGYPCMVSLQTVCLVCGTAWLIGMEEEERERLFLYCVYT